MTEAGPESPKRRPGTWSRRSETITLLLVGGGMVLVGGGIAYGGGKLAERNRARACAEAGIVP